MAVMAIASLVAFARSARAGDQFVPGTKLLLKSTSTTEKLVFVSRGSFSMPSSGSGDAPTNGGASLEILNPGTMESFTFDGFFCPGQKVPGAFGQTAARTIRETGSPLLGGPSLFSTTLAGNFCIPATGTPLIDNSVDLPGPGAISVPGTISVCLLGLLCL